MCGLMGCMMKQPDKRVAIYLAVTGVLMDGRGGHSWGYATNSGVTKNTGHFSQNVNLNGFDGPMFLGHCRYATVGDITKENSHPFEQGDVVGAHNGGVANWKELNEQYQRDFNVDSQHIFEQIAHDLPLEDVAASGAITYFNKKDTSVVNLCRMVSGSLYVGAIYEDEKVKDKDVHLGTVWASTDVAVRAGLITAGFKNFKIFEPKWDQIYEARSDGVVYETDAVLKFGSRFVYEREKDDKQRAAAKAKTEEWQRNNQGRFKHRDRGWVAHGGERLVGGKWVAINDTKPEKEAVVTVDDAAVTDAKAVWEGVAFTFSARCFGCGVVTRCKNEQELGIPLCFYCDDEWGSDPDADSERAMQDAITLAMAKDDDLPVDEIGW